MLSSPGKMPADTKLFLYLDPGGVLHRASNTWDSSQFAGTVPHQQISYLWPAGPWYWAMDRLHVPDWIAHRLWIASLLFFAGWGVHWLARQLGFRSHSAPTAAFVYMLSPYVLAYISRTSVMMLPWAGLGWLVGCTVLAARHGGWRYPACAALVVLTVGSTNATALALIAPAPIIWLLHAASSKEITWRNAAIATARIGALALLVSAWWIVFLGVQSRYGIDILAYTETLEAVSSTSIAPETVRGLGYWLNYIRDHVQATTDAAGPYHTNFALLLTSYGLALIGIVGLALVKWNGRRFAAILLLVGTVLAVGVYPLSHPAPLFSAVADNTRSTLALALRSSTRALPMAILALSLGTAAAVGAIGHINRQRVAGGTIALLAIVNLPALWTGGLVDRFLTRAEQPPSAWQQATASLTNDANTRVWQLPGAEFGAFRWGYTVDPPLPGMSSQPFISRDLQPLGSPAAMDLLYALDDRFQNGVVDADSIAAVARLFGVETIWVAGDMAFERFRTPRPETTDALYRTEPNGLAEPRAFGAPAVNHPAVPMLDEVAISDPRIGQQVAPVLLVDVEDPVAITRTKTSAVVLSGSGDGVVDAAAAGLLNGQEVIFYSASLGDELDERLADAALVIVTDSNRDRARQWRGSQDSTGFTEDGALGPDVSRFDSQDQRLPVFADYALANLTYVSSPQNQVSATASSYGYPLGYWPEYRAAMAIDGDPETAWRVGGLAANPVGESISLQTPVAIEQFTLQQPSGDRRITEVDLVTADGAERVVLADNSQTVTLSRATTDVTIVIRAATPGVDPVGFAEIDTGLGAAEEVVVLPSDALSRVSDQPLALVMTRERVRATDRYRRDPETVISRQFDLNQPESLTPSITVRVDSRAGDDVLAELLGAPTARASGSLAGVLTARPWAAIDGDETTAWTSPFGDAVGQWIEVTPAPDIESLQLTQLADDAHARITSVRVERDGQTAVADLAGEGSNAVAVPVGSGPVRLTVLSTDGATTIDRRLGTSIGVPVAIAELSARGLGEELPANIDGDCRNDLLSIDNEPIALRVTGSTAEALTGAALQVELCEPNAIDLAAGSHILRSTAGTGLTVDRVVLQNERAIERAPSAAAVSVAVTASDDERDLTIGACPEGCWLIFGEGFNDGWSATSPELGSLAGTTLVDGGFNGWWLAPHDGTVHVHLKWAGQRPVDIALWVSGLAALGCVVLAGWPIARRRFAGGTDSNASLAPNPEFIAPTFAWWPSDRVASRTALASAIGTVAAAGLLVGPLGAAGAAAVTLATCGWWRRPQLNAVAGLAGAVISTLYVLLQAIRLGPLPGSPFLSAVSDAHQPFVLAIVLIASGALSGHSTKPANPARG